MSSRQRRAIAKQKIERERQQLLAMSTQIRLKSVSPKELYESVMVTVCEVFDVTPECMVGKSQVKSIYFARHAYCHLVSSLDPSASLCSIGRSLNRNHSTVINSIRKCNNLRETDYSYATQFERCVDKLIEGKSQDIERFKVSQMQNRATQRQREMQRAVSAVELVSEFIKVWDNQILSEGFNKDSKAIVAAFNDLRTKAAQHGF